MYDLMSFLKLHNAEDNPTLWCEYVYNVLEPDGYYFW